MDLEFLKHRLHRRHLMTQLAGGLGMVALGSLWGSGRAQASGEAGKSGAGTQGLPYLPHFKPRAKRVIYLFQSGGPSHIDLFDYKPRIAELNGKELPDSIRQGQRITGMTSGQKSFPVAAPQFQFQAHGQSGIHFSELLPYTGKIADEMTLIKSMHTEAINHDPAMTIIQTGSQQLGRPSMGAWVSYGLGSENDNLPTYVVLHSNGGRIAMQPLYARLWGSGFLPSNHQGVQFRGRKDPVLYLNNPDGITRDRRRAMLDGVARLNELALGEFGDPEIETRISQYEMAFRMQASVPELMDTSKESEATFALYGEQAKKPGSFAANCLLARRLAERGVRFIQLFHRGWDQHGNLPKEIRYQTEATDQASAALILDLKQRGLLEDTLVIWGGEFGRTIYSQGTLTQDNYGRDHHGRCFSVWMAGGGIRKGLVYGETDDYCYNIVKNPVHINDLNATILKCLGIRHDRFSFKFQGLDQRLTGVEEVKVIDDILA